MGMERVKKKGKINFPFFIFLSFTYYGTPPNGCHFSVSNNIPGINNVTKLSIKKR